MHNDHNFRPDLIPVLVWSEDTKLRDTAIKIINSEFDENLYIFTTEHLHLPKSKSTENISAEIEKYDFHVIKVSEKIIELILKNDERHKSKIGNLEEDLEKFARQIIDYNHKFHTKHIC
jgi:hypothetical protein